MALETLKDVKFIRGFAVITDNDRPKNSMGDTDWGAFDKLRESKPICVDHDAHMISFKIQQGPIKEKGVNGCQLDCLIAVALEMITKLNDKFPCIENANAREHLQSALFWLDERKAQRERRGVEGFNKQ